MLPKYFDNDDHVPVTVHASGTCDWQRDSCRKPNCFLCCRMKTGRNRKEEEEMLRKQKRRLLEEFSSTIDASLVEHDTQTETQHGETYILPHQQLIDWRTAVAACLADQHKQGALWLQSEAGKDIVWYIQVLPVHYLESVILVRKTVLNETEQAAFFRSSMVVRESFRKLIQAFDELMRYKETADLFFFFYSELQHIKAVYEQGQKNRDILCQ